MNYEDLQNALERVARQAALRAIAEMDLPNRSRLMVSGMGGVAKLLDMSRSKLHRLRAAGTREGIPFPEPAIYLGLGGTKSYWVADVESWIRDVSEASVHW